MSNENFRSASQILSSLFDGIDKNTMDNALNLVNGWKKIVSTISTSKSEKNKTGVFLASHSRVIDLKNGILLVEADHPSHIQMLQIYNTYIMNGLKKNYPNLEINVISYRLAGTNIKLKNYDNYDKNDTEQPSENQKTMTNQSVNYDNTDNLCVETTLPQELQEQFEKLRQIMTNQ